MNEKLKALREKFNYSQNSVAQYLGVSRQMYIKYEKGEVEPPLKVILNLSSLYKVPCEMLIRSFDNNNQESVKSDSEKEAVYQFSGEPVLTVSDCGANYSAEQMYYNTVVNLFKKMVFTQQLKAFAEIAGVIQKHSEEIAESMLETKKEKDPLQDIWARSDASKGKTTKWKWNREELYDREICRHRGE